MSELEIGDEMKIIERLEDSLDYDFQLNFNERKDLLSCIKKLQHKMSLMEEDIRTGKEIIGEYKQENKKLLKLKERYQLEKEIYKSRCEKALERLSFEKGKMGCAKYQGCFTQIENILRGDNND